MAAQAERLDLEMLSANLSQPEALQCCCGKTDCVFLKHNCSVLDSVEKDVHTAARLGQALLARHEAYLASAERERFEMQARIEQLETDKKFLEDENARTIQENRALLDQLEALNNTVSDSETQIRSLEATLQSSEQTIRKLEAAEARAAEMEDKITDLEAEQATLQNTVVSTEAEARSAMHRWRKAERGISDLQEKLEKMEREAREERDRHAEILGRMEKQRAMEKDLNTAAGRLKGAAAAKTIGDGKDGGTVVSHFVRDLLQDNANLQLGMAELREMLINSNDEIQQLREQLLFHQPADDDEEASTASTLMTELRPEDAEPTEPKSPASPSRPQPKTSLSQELHIHHHYHVSRPNDAKKPKKKRQNLNANTLVPPRPFEPSSPPSPGQGPGPWRLQRVPTAPSFMSHSVKDSISTAPSTRWSVFSEQPSDFAPSSAPSSPTSNRRPSALDRGFDPSYPVSPSTSIDPASPAWIRQHKRQPSDASRRKFFTPRPLFLGGLPEDDSGFLGVPGAQRTQRPTEDDNTALATTEDVLDLATTTASSESSTAVSMDSSDALPSMPLTPSFDDYFASSPLPRLRRAASQESIMSLSGGLDIHTLKSRPSQLTLRPLGAAHADIGLSDVIAHPILSRGHTDGKRGSLVLRDNLLSIPDLLSGGLSESAATTEGRERSFSGGGLGKLVGWRPWASNSPKQPDDASSTSTTERSRSLSPNKSPTASPGSSFKDIGRSHSSDAITIKSPKEAAFSPRSFGINQPGAIPGFQKFLAYHQRRAPPSKIVPDIVDTEALREGLQE